MTELKRRLTDEQEQAAHLWEKAITLIAAAGSGKTTVLVERYLDCLQRGVSPSQILVVTFTNEAADQLKLRIEKALAASNATQSLEQAAIGTLHSFCYRTLNQYGSLAALEPIQNILSHFEFLSTFDKAYRSWLAALSKDQLNSLLTFVSHRELREIVPMLYRHRFLLQKQLPLVAQGELEGDFLTLLWELTRPLLNNLSETFAQRGLLSFDDLEHYTLQILQNEEALKRLQETYRYFLVDEFQDTSAIQWEILSKLVSKHPDRLFVVGDPKQSIYRFRNADHQLFLKVANQMKENGGAVLELTNNFRSSPALLSQLNHLSVPLFERTPIPFSPMQPGRKTGEEFPVHALKVLRSSGEEIRVVASYLKEQTKTIPAEDFTLLFRVSDRMGDYAEALKEVGINSVCKRTVSLFHSYDVLDLMNYLKAMQDPLDDFALAAFFRSHYAQVSYAQLWTLQQQPGTNLYEKSKTELSHLKWFFDLIEKGELDVRTLLFSLFKSSSYWPQSWDGILQVLAPLLNPPVSLHEAIEKLEIWKKEGVSIQSEAEAFPENAVRLMTVHAAKGLEFPHVLLVDTLRQSPKRTPRLFALPNVPPAIRFKIEGEPVESDAYKKLQEENAIEDIEEGKRVLYVALTRAMESLTIVLPSPLKTLPKGSWAEWLEKGLLNCTGFETQQGGLGTVEGPLLADLNTTSTSAKSTDHFNCT